MSPFFRVFAVVCLSILSGDLLAATPQQKPLVVGMVPYNSAPVVIGQHRPMINHLRAEFGSDVEFVTAPGFRTYFDEAVKGSYDVMAMPSHFARLLQRDHGFVPLLRYEGGARGLVVVASKGPISGYAQLAGKVVAVPDRAALATILALDWLEKKGLRAGRDFTLFEAITFNAAAISVDRGEAAAAVSAPAALVQMSPETRSSFRTIADSGEFPNLIFLAHPRLSTAEREKIKHSLLAFGVSPSGKAFIEATGFRGIAPVTPELMRKLDPYLKETRRILGLKVEPKAQ